MVSELTKAPAPDFLSVFNVLPGMYLLLSPDLRVIAVSDEYLDCLSLSRERVIGKTIPEFFSPPYAANPGFVAELNQLLATVLARRSRQTAESTFSRPVKAGSIELCNQIWQISCIPITDQEGTLNCVLHLAASLEDQKNAERELQESTEQFKFLADTIPQLVWTTDPKGSHDYFNQRWTEFTGYSVEDSLGPDMWNNLLHPDDRERARTVWNHSLQTGDPYEIEYRFKSAHDGRFYWFLGRALPMRDAAGKIVKWFGTCTDISRKKQFEEELKEKNEELKLINDDLDSFVYMASHDLKLPLINISALFEELLPNMEVRDQEAYRMIDLIRNSLKQVHETIDNLGKIVKVQKNVFAQEEDIDLSTLLKEVMLSITELISDAEARIEADFSKAPVLRFSRINLKSVLYNLLSNAVKFRSPHRSPHITLKTMPTEEGILLEVTDNGMGIDLNKHGDKLFQMFKRFHSHVDGSGLGLHIISRIMHKSGGRIEVSSQPEQGSTFSLIFANNSKTHVGE